MRDVIPKYFVQTKYESFTRQLNGEIRYVEKAFEYDQNNLLDPLTHAPYYYGPLSLYFHRMGL